MQSVLPLLAQLVDRLEAEVLVAVLEVAVVEPLVKAKQ
jgi:hypothetical protein